MNNPLYLVPLICLAWIIITFFAGCETDGRFGPSYPVMETITHRNGDWLDLYDTQGRWIGGANIAAIEGGYDCGQIAATRHDQEQGRLHGYAP